MQFRSPKIHRFHNYFKLLTTKNDFANKPGIQTAMEEKYWDTNQDISALV